MSNFKNNKYLYYPIFFLIILFFIEKIFYLPYFQESFIQSGNAVFYLQREVLFKKLLKDPEVKKLNLAIAMGDSRAYAFSRLGLRDDLKKRWTIYNFSGPQALPVYAFYWFEKIIQAKIIPKTVFLVLSPEGFNDNINAFYDPFLKYGADFNFVKNHYKEIPNKDLAEYFLDKIFPIRKVAPDGKLFLKRLRGHEMSEYNPDLNSTMLSLNLYNGEYLGYGTLNNNIKKLDADALRLKNIYLNKYQVHQTQLYFVEKILSLAKENDVKVYLIWPKVYKEYQKEYEKLQLNEYWWSKVEILSKKYSMKSFNFNDISKCDLFYDASHQSLICVVEQLEYIFADWESVKTK